MRLFFFLGGGDISSQKPAINCAHPKGVTVFQTHTQSQKSGNYTVMQIGATSPTCPTVRLMACCNNRPYIVVELLGSTSHRGATTQHRSRSRPLPPPSAHPPPLPLCPSIPLNFPSGRFSPDWLTGACLGCTVYSYSGTSSVGFSLTHGFFFSFSGRRSGVVPRSKIGTDFFFLFFSFFFFQCAAVCVNFRRRRPCVGGIH